ncbi:MAG: hypothetical protein WCH86_07475 [Kiritimatiellales bacterium]
MFQGLKRSGGGDIDVLQHDTGDCDHLESERQRGLFLFICVRRNFFSHWRVVMRDVRPHADHIHVEFFHKKYVVDQIVHCLAGQSHHYAGADLITGLFEQGEAVFAHFKVVIRRMQFAVQFRISGFDAEQVAMCARFAPAAVGLFCLLSERERDAEFTIRGRFNPPEHPLNQFDIRRVLPLAGLNYDRAIFVFERPDCLAHHFLFVHLETFHVRVALADTAVIAVLDADIAALNNAAEIGDLADVLCFHPVRAVVQSLQFRRIGDLQQSLHLRWSQLLVTINFV